MPLTLGPRAARIPGPSHFNLEEVRFAPAQLENALREVPRECIVRGTVRPPLEIDLYERDTEAAR